MEYTKEQLQKMGFRIEDDWELYVEGDYVATDDATVDMTVEYLFHAEPNEEGLFEIGDGRYAIHAEVLSIDSWNGEGEPPFRVGDVFDTLDDVTFADCRELSYLDDSASAGRS